MKIKSNLLLYFSLVTIILIISSNAYGQRVPVLNQIELPHNYYYRELYLPQLTSGPSSASWLDGNTIIYSMAGSLWKQNVDSETTEQLTDGNGYDYQPDCNADRD